MHTRNRSKGVLTLAAVLCVASAAQAGTVGYRNTVLADNPLVYYEFDETNGAVSANSGSTGAANVGTINGAIELGHLSFLNGGTSYDFLGGHVWASPVPSSLTEWTLEAWVNWNPAKDIASNFFGNDQVGWNDDVPQNLLGNFLLRHHSS